MLDEALCGVTGSVQLSPHKVFMYFSILVSELEFRAYLRGLTS